MPTRIREPLSEVYEKSARFGDASAVCPHCGDNVGFVATHQVSLDGPPRVRHHYQVADIGYCRTCRDIVVGATKQVGRGVVGYLLWPTTVWPDRAPEGLGQQIKKPYDEARSILELSPQGAAVLARRCLQHVIREKLEITRRTLFKEIEEAKQRDELSKPTRDAIDHVREIGIWGAHPIETGESAKADKEAKSDEASEADEGSEADEASTIIEVTKEEAEYTMQTLEMLFDDLYVKPTRIASMMKSISDRKSGLGDADQPPSTHEISL